ncbi:MAG TPA: sigma-70 family RNA polymerase sigma factor [Kofleriaceae bacterium]
METLLARIAERFPDIRIPASQLLSMVSAETKAELSDSDEVALAWAAGLGSERAMAEIEPMFVAAGRHLRARGHAPDVAVEAAQSARVALLTGEPAIFKFSGRGALGAFVRVVCVRHALQHVRHAKRDDVFEQLTTSALETGPELDLLRNTYREQVTRAMVSAWAQLAKHDRFILSLHLHAKHSVSQIANVYGIHRVNAARRLAGARTALVRATRDVLRSELRVSPATVSSVLRLTSFNLSAGDLAPASGVAIAP